MKPGTTSRAPTVSVIVANYNGASHLAETIDSACRQSLREIEIIVADDASTDGSVQIISTLMAHDPRIRLVASEHNGGPAAARNRAIATATGTWLAIMDSDDRMHAERLERLVAAAERDGADIVADDLLTFGAAGNQPPRRLLRGRWAAAPFRVDIVDYVRLNNFYGRGPALGYLKPLFRAALLESPGARYDESLRIAEDYDLVVRLLLGGRHFRVYPQPLYFYRKHSRSISHRLSQDALSALAAANRRFMTEIAGNRASGDYAARGSMSAQHALAAALSGRARSIETALAYERLLDALKARSWLRAMRAVRDRPQSLLLLRLPLAVRLRRLLPGTVGPSLPNPDIEDLRSST
jgi:succinoglycan biosynthesis protein ExoO